MEPGYNVRSSENSIVDDSCATHVFCLPVQADGVTELDLQNDNYHIDYDFDLPVQMPRSPSHQLVQLSDINCQAYLFADTDCQKMVAGTVQHKQRVSDTLQLTVTSRSDPCKFTFGPSKPTYSDTCHDTPVGVASQLVLSSGSEVSVSAPGFYPRPGLAIREHVAVRVDDWPKQLSYGDQPFSEKEAPQLCEVCGTFARVPFRYCRRCRHTNVWRHGRCCKTGAALTAPVALPVVASEGHAQRPNLRKQLCFADASSSPVDIRTSGMAEALASSSEPVFRVHLEDRPNHLLVRGNQSSQGPRDQHADAAREYCVYDDEDNFSGPSSSSDEREFLPEQAGNVSARHGSTSTRRRGSEDPHLRPLWMPVDIGRRRQAEVSGSRGSSSSYHAFQSFGVGKERRRRRQAPAEERIDALPHHVHVHPLVGGLPWNN